MTPMKSFSFHICIVFLLACNLFACVSPKKNIYIQENKSFQEYNLQRGLYLLKPQDVLSIDINAVNYKDFGYNVSSNRSSSSNPVLDGYIIDKDGYIKLPFATIKVDNVSLDEARAKITAQVKEYIKDAIVNVNLLTYNVTVIGEVLRPGLYVNYNPKLTIFEALGLAGDINQFGNPKKLKLIRTVGDKASTYAIDLTDNKLINSEFYFIQPHDVLYVEPGRAKNVNANNSVASIVLSALSVVSIIVGVILR